MRIGIGYDVHKLIENRPLILGGVTVPFEKGLLGHSDADVLVHAVIDALLGAMAKGDIGRLFPDTDDKYKGISSMKLLSEVKGLIFGEGYVVCNLDTIIIAQAPKLAAYIDDMRSCIAACLDISKEQVSVKATTEEGLGFTGAGGGIAAKAVCLLGRVSNTAQRPSFSEFCATLR